VSYLVIICPTNVRRPGLKWVLTLAGSKGCSRNELSLSRKFASNLAVYTEVFCPSAENLKVYFNYLATGMRFLVVYVQSLNVLLYMALYQSDVTVTTTQAGSWRERLLINEKKEKSLMFSEFI